jgi:hypothetical protein
MRGLCLQAILYAVRPDAILIDVSGAASRECFMVTFDERERAYEKKFALDEELRFKATARRNKLLGLWAAEIIGLGEAEAEAYAKDVVIADLEEPGEEDVFRKIRDDLDARGVEQSDHQIRRIMDDLMTKAIDQIENESKA